VRTARILPESYGITYRLVKDTAVFRLDRPCNISVEPDGKSELLLFAGAPEKNPPHQGDSGVIYYGPGLHDAGMINVGSNQTLYLAGGAVVKGGVKATGSNITICGRGIFDGSGGRGGNAQLRNCSYIRIRDVIFNGSSSWCFVPTGCDSITIDNIKICNSSKINDDGIDLVNCEDAHVKGCFVRADDDCICVKAMDRSRPSHRILVEDCELWTDKANIFRIGYECELTGIMADGLVVRNIEVLHTTEFENSIAEHWANCVFSIQPTDNAPMGNMLFENVRVNGGEGSLIRMFPLLPIVGPGRGTQPGHYIKNCTFKNVRQTAGHTPLPIYIAGIDSTHFVDSITLENVQRMGKCAEPGMPDVILGAYATNVKFTCTPDRIDLVSPLPGQLFQEPGSFTLIAEVPGSAAQRIKKVVFRQGSKIIGEDATPADGFNCSVSGLSAGSYAFTAQAVGDGGPIATSPVIDACVGAVRKADRPGKTLQGLSYRYYEGVWSKLPDFSSLKPVAAGTVDRFRIDIPKRRDDDFGISFTGYLDVPVTGAYTFYTWSDDGVRIWIGNERIINDDTVHASTSYLGTIALAAGKHPITVGYFDHLGGDILRVAWWTPGYAKEEIPACRLTHAAEGKGKGGW